MLDVADRAAKATLAIQAMELLLIRRSWPNEKALSQRCGYQMLTSLGVDYAQGYGVAQPQRVLKSAVA
jgi:predicted phage gp36 major capsid-like protein